MISAPRKPIPKIICDEILDEEFGSTIEDTNVKIGVPKIMAPVMAHLDR
jgi:hypothetical protein